MNAEYEMRCYDDQAGLEHLTEIGRHYLADIYAREKKGMYKSDLARVAILKRYGGIYVDSDVKSNVPFKQVLQFVPEGTIVTVKSDSNNGAPGKNLIYNAFVRVPFSNHPLMDVILDLYEEYYRLEDVHFCSTSGLDAYWLGPCIWKIALNEYEGDDVFLLRESNICGGSWGILPENGDCSKLFMNSKF